MIKQIGAPKIKHSIIGAYYNYAKVITHGDTYRFSSDSRTIIYHLEGNRISLTVGGKKHIIDMLMPYFQIQKPNGIVRSRALLIEKIN